MHNSQSLKLGKFKSIYKITVVNWLDEYGLALRKINLACLGDAEKLLNYGTIILMINLMFLT